MSGIWPPMSRIWDCILQCVHIWKRMKQYACYVSPLCLSFSFGSKLLLLRTCLLSGCLIFSGTNDPSAQAKGSHHQPQFKSSNTPKPLPQQCEPVEHHAQHQEGFLQSLWMATAPRNSYKYGLRLSCTPWYQEFKQVILVIMLKQNLDVWNLLGEDS